MRSRQGVTAETVPKTPSRREALYERLRQRSLSASPIKAATSEVKGGEADPRPTLENGPRRTAKKVFAGPPRWCRRKRLDVSTILQTAVKGEKPRISLSQLCKYSHHIHTTALCPFALPKPPGTARETIIFSGIRGPCGNLLCPCDLVTLSPWRPFGPLSVFFCPFSSLFKLEKGQKFYVKSLMYFPCQWPN